MRDRPLASARAGRSATISLALVLCRPAGRGLAVLLVRAVRGRERWTVPYVGFSAGEELEAAAMRGAGTALGAVPAWLAQVRAFGDAKAHPAGAALSVAYVGVTAGRTGDAPRGGRWFAGDHLPPLAARQRAIVVAAVEALRERLDRAPIAFRLLPAAFTLSELQGVYELLLGRRLHKASFRRALQAAFLVEPMDEWRREGRGRPAQLFHFAPRRRRDTRRGVRFELTGG